MFGMDKIISQILGGIDPQEFAATMQDVIAAAERLKRIEDKVDLLASCLITFYREYETNERRSRAVEATEVGVNHGSGGRAGCETGETPGGCGGGGSQALEDHRGARSREEEGTEGPVEGPVEGRVEGRVEGPAEERPAQLGVIPDWLRNDRNV